MQNDDGKMQNENPQEGSLNLSIIHYDEERVPNPSPEGTMSWQTYQTARNILLKCCRRFGTVGPMEECPIDDGAEEPSLERWKSSGIDDPDYFLLDDQWNDERYIYIEFCRAAAFTQPWVEAIAETLASMPGWGVGLGASFRRGYLLIFEDKVMVNGPAFAGCNDLPAVVKAGQAAFNSG